ncbi:TPA: hypothetical protein JLJ52_004886 [Escherichia coli]|nr:hypothetical protein [Escherichia coli]
MKKKIITSVIALAFSAGSVYANTSGTEIGSATQTITLPVLATTCSVNFPGDVVLGELDVSTFNALGMNGILSTEDMGTIDFQNCNGTTVNLSVSTSNTVSASGYIYPTYNGAVQQRVGYWIRVNSSGAKPNQTADHLQNISVNSASFSIPVQIQTVKLVSGDWGQTVGGNLVATVTYTATYA